MKNEVYDILNKLQRWLPALGAFYLEIARIWSLPFAEQINSTIIEFAILLAATLEVASLQYYKNHE